MGRPFIAFIIVLTVLSGFTSRRGQASPAPTDAEKLGMAIDYFQSQKYHEALLLLLKIDAEYNLNPRYRAYIGVCYYHEWEYKAACQYLDSVMPQLQAFAPHERSVYYFANGESHFQLQEYAKAIGCYEQLLNVCYDNEKGDAFYRLGFCHMYGQRWQEAYENFVSSRRYYTAFNTDERSRQRIAQLRHMEAGCLEHLTQRQDTVMLADSTTTIVTHMQ